MKFIPFDNKIHVEPIKKITHILTEDESLVEAGKVIAIGKHVTFCAVGEIIAFDAWGCQKTPEIDGVQCYVVPEDKNVILGKYGSDE